MNRGPVSANLTKVTAPKSTLLIIFLFCQLASAEITPGRWVLACASGVARTQLFKESSVTLTESFHQDRDCLDLSFEFITSGDVIYPQADNIDFTYRRVFLALHKNALIDDFNARRVCGISQWTLHAPVDITGRECAIFNFTKTTKIPSDGDTKFGIYRIDDGGLIYGKLTRENDGSSPQRRPVTFEAERIYYLKR